MTEFDLPVGPVESDRRWGIREAVFGVLIANLAGLVVGVVIIAATGNVEEAADGELSLALIALLQIPLWFGYLGAPLYAATQLGTSLAHDFWCRFQWRDVPIGLGVGVVTQLLLVPLLYFPILRVIGERDLSEVARELTDRATDPVGVVLLFVIVVVAAPVIEELFFRGLLQRAVDHRWGQRWAVAASAVVFGAVHLQPLQFPALVLFGLVAALLTERYRRLGPAIFAHVGFNAVATIGLLLSA